MDVEEFKEKVEDLNANLDDLEEALQPLLKQDLADTTSKLPLLEKAKLNVLTTYAIESLLFSILKLHGTDAKSHPVFTELTRVKQYFAKIEAVEAKIAGGAAATKQAPNLTLDKGAANRFIKHALSTNSNQTSKVPAKIIFDERNDTAKKASSTQTSSTVTKRKAPHTTDEAPSSSSSSSASSSSSDSEPEPTKPTPASKQTPAREIKSGTSAAESQERKGQWNNPIPHHGNKHGHTISKAAKVKSNQPPRSGSSVFQDLLSRPRKKPKEDEKK